MHPISAGERVELRLWPNDQPYTGTVVEVREAVPQADPRIRRVDNEAHALVDVDTGGQAAVALAELRKIED